jgi:hypothetical protein
VSRDALEKQLDVRGDAFTRVLTPDMIAQLPDDPDELENVLRQMAGPGATFRINGFGGSGLPPKGQIRQIRFSLNTFSAEMHELGMPIVDIVTQPGLDRWHTTLNAGFRNEALTARYAFAPTSAAESVGRGGLVMDGPLWRNHTSLSLSVDGTSLSDSQIYNAATLSGRVNGVATRPTDRTNVSLLVEHALTKAHTSRLEFIRSGTGIDNLGVGGAEKDINPTEIHGRACTLIGSVVFPMGWLWDLARFLAISGLSFEPAVTHRLSLDDAPEAFKLADEGRAGKIIFLPNG